MRPKQLNRKGYPNMNRVLCTIFNVGDLYPLAATAFTNCGCYGASTLKVLFHTIFFWLL